jgi:hypothetical protein
MSVPQHHASSEVSTPQANPSVTLTWTHEPAGALGAQTPAPSHAPSPAAVIVQVAPAALGVSGEQMLAPEQVPASVHCVEGQVKPAQGSGKGPVQHAAHAAAAQPSVHSSAQVPSPQQSSGAGEARARGARAPSARNASASAAQGRSIMMLARVRVWAHTC